MTNPAYRRRRRQLATSLPAAFEYGRDTHSTDFLDAGEPTDGSTGLGAPRPNVHRLSGVARLLDLDERYSGRPLAGVWGPPRGPHASPVVPGRAGRRGATVSARVGPPRRPLKAIRQRRTDVAADWRAFSVLRAMPRNVGFCVARRVRRSVLFALGVGGRRGSARGGSGGYRRTVTSQWSC